SLKGHIQSSQHSQSYSGKTIVPLTSDLSRPRQSSQSYSGCDLAQLTQTPKSEHFKFSSDEEKSQKNLKVAIDKQHLCQLPARGDNRLYNIQIDCNQLILRNIIQENPSLYLDEIILQMKARTGKHVSISTIWRSQEQNELLRSAFMARVGPQYTSDQLVFLDESYKDLPQINTFPHAKSVLILDNARIHHDDG
ncbi:41759_t:CDS:2, partial [Gigaspora margarita]